MPEPTTEIPDSSTSWADQVEQEDEPDKVLPQSTEVIKNGIKTITEFKRNEDDKIVKVVRTYRLETLKVHKAIAKRKLWTKFGDSKMDKPGPNPATTMVAEDVFLVLTSNKEELNQQDDDPLRKLQNQKNIVQCRICKGDHWTLKCPYKDTLEPLQQQLKEEENGGSGSGEGNNKATSFNQTGGKYVAPGRREGASGRGEMMSTRNNREETATIRVTNLSEDTRESDLQDLFRPFGPISRIYLAKDKITNQSKGFAFINFIRRDDAAQAIKCVSGLGYDHLILNVEWARPSNN
ncbi:eukaryotic translation initiation factor 3 subunit G-like [Xenia sp. Carnegie-2017]|uniref:eukaryotic translation initiation factor 3 subunit G-like n=1 Tax=Xenia sp. Carnegie-2017 TaxID=2897299 RepID=UPI001F041EAE|nr:eukaryotic translation initiation factor 3 subunit G-like [Xenia sp. Carnegie-2017]